MKALILAAGYATRLYPLTKEYPKPLLRVRNRPIIDYIVDKLEIIKNIDEIIVVTNSKFMPNFKNWISASHCRKPLTLVDDLTKSLEGRRGAIGDMDFAISKRRIKSDLLVIGGDNLFDEDLNGFLSFSEKVKGSPLIGVYNIKNRKELKKYGIVMLDRKKRVIDFEEKPLKPKSTFAAMCLYYFPKGKLKLLKRYLKTSNRGSDATGFYIDWLRGKTPVYGFVFDGNWYDIGDFKFYNKAKTRFKQ